MLPEGFPFHQFIIIFWDIFALYWKITFKNYNQYRRVYISFNAHVRIYVAKMYCFFSDKQISAVVWSMTATRLQNRTLLVGWTINWLIHWWIRGLIYLFIYLFIYWLIDWLIDRLKAWNVKKDTLIIICLYFRTAFVSSSF